MARILIASRKLDFLSPRITHSFIDVDARMMANYFLGTYSATIKSIFNFITAITNSIDLSIPLFRLN